MQLSDALRSVRVKSSIASSTTRHFSRDINKTNHYCSLAANKNDTEAQYNLGVIYDEDEYISRDINKSIHYYSLAANQNDTNIFIKPENYFLNPNQNFKKG